MNNKPGNSKPGATAATREDRLKQALKANLARRKAQTRARKVASEQDKEAD